MKITKREILFSAIILTAMIGIGTLISRAIVNGVTEHALAITSSAQVRTNEQFSYIKRTNAGNFLAEGALIAVDSISIPDIAGYYGKIRKELQEYREHTRTVTTTDSEGNTHTHTETYWEWDTIEHWEWESKTLSFLGCTFTPKQIGYRHNTSYKETITPKRGFFERKIRYKYYTAPTVTRGMMTGTAQNKAFNDINFREGMTIQKTVEDAENSIKTTPIVFWVLWLLLTAGLIFIFYDFDNKWLEDNPKKLISDEQLVKEIREFLGAKGIEQLKKDFWFSWGTVIGGNLGMQTRNYLRNKHPELDKRFPNYADFEDYITDLVKQKIVCI